MRLLALLLSMLIKCPRDCADPYSNGVDQPSDNSASNHTTRKRSHDSTELANSTGSSKKKKNVWYFCYFHKPIVDNAMTLFACVYRSRRQPASTSCKPHSHCLWRKYVSSSWRVCYRLHNIPGGLTLPIVEKSKKWSSFTFMDWLKACWETHRTSIRYLKKSTIHTSLATKNQCYEIHFSISFNAQWRKVLNVDKWQVYRFPMYPFCFLKCIGCSSWHNLHLHSFKG